MWINIHNVHSSYVHNIYTDKSTHMDCENGKGQIPATTENIRKNTTFDIKTFNSAKRRWDSGLTVSLIRHNRTVARASVLWRDINWLTDWFTFPKIPKPSQQIPWFFHHLPGTVVIFWDLSGLENATVRWKSAILDAEFSATAEYLWNLQSIPVYSIITNWCHNQLSAAPYRMHRRHWQQSPWLYLSGVTPTQNSLTQFKSDHIIVIIIIIINELIKEA